MNYYSWGMQTAMPIYWENAPGAQNKGDRKGKTLTWMGKPKTRPGGGVHARSDWSLKTNERSAAKQMPLLGEFSRYSEWGKEAKMWARNAI